MAKTPGGCVTAYLILDTLHLNVIGRWEVTVLSQLKKIQFYFALNLKISKAFECDRDR